MSRARESEGDARRSTTNRFCVLCVQEAPESTGFVLNR